MNEEYFPNPEEEIRREGKVSRGLDPDFRYPGRRFVTAAAFRLNVPHFINIAGVAQIAVLLLTFRRPVTVKRARRFLNNIWRRFFKGIFGHYALVVEFTKTGRIHFHIVAQAFSDLRTGFNFEHYCDYKIANERAAAEGKPFTCKLRRLLRDAMPANDALRALWAKLDKHLTKFGFGPVFHLFPIKTNDKALSRYLSKGFLKGLHLQGDENKGAHLVSYSRGFPRAVPSGWKPPCPWWDERMHALVNVCGYKDRHAFKERLDSKWGFRLMGLIGWMEFDHGPGWPHLPLHVLAPAVLHEIMHVANLVEHLGVLVPDIKSVVRTNRLPAQPPVPPPSTSPASAMWPPPPGLYTSPLPPAPERPYALPLGDLGGALLFPQPPTPPPSGIAA